VALILLVEDDTALSQLVADYLSGAGFDVVQAYRGDVVEEVVRQREPDLVVLDLMLPGLDGLAVCKVLRGFSSVPILMLTALGDEVDEIVGLEVGADDYLGKPVRPRLLLARVRSLLRRSAESGTTSLILGPLVLEPHRRRILLEGVPLDLPDAEYDLLGYLMDRVGLVVDRDTLYKDLRGVSWDGVDRSIDLRVSRLRAKLGAHSHLLKSVRGRGYLLVRL